MNIKNFPSFLPAVTKVKTDLLDEKIAHVLDTEDPDAGVLASCGLDLLVELLLVLPTLLGDLCKVH